MLKKRVPEMRPEPKPGGIALGRRPIAVACKSCEVPLREVVISAPPLLTTNDPTTIFDCCAVLRLPSLLVPPMVPLLLQVLAAPSPPLHS